MKKRLKIDDTLDVFAVHGVAGMVGSLLVALFALITLIGAVILVRVAAEAEYDRLDLSTHGERAYDHT